MGLCLYWNLPSEYECCHWQYTDNNVIKKGIYQCAVRKQMRYGSNKTLILINTGDTVATFCWPSPSHIISMSQYIDK